MTRRRIDIHAHFPIDVRSGARPGAPWESWDTPTALRRLDRFEIERQVLSLPGLPSSHTLARSVNELFAQIIAEAPDRFGAFATAPGDDPESALAEVRRALDELGLSGIALPSNVSGRYLGDPWFEPLFAEAARRGVPVFIHPSLHPQAASLALGRAPFLVEFPFDTFRSVVDAIYAGVFRRHPDLRMIVAHCGGPLPSLAWRVDTLAGLATPPGSAPAPGEVHAALSRLYLDTALSGSPDLLRAAIALVGPDHVLYGTDSGAAPEEIIDLNTSGLLGAGLPDADLAAIEYGTAAELFSWGPTSASGARG